MLPVVCRLSPRIPGYVMTVCEETRVESRERHVVARRSSGCDGAIVKVVVGSWRLFQSQQSEQFSPYGSNDV